MPKPSRSWGSAPLSTALCDACVPAAHAVAPSNNATLANCSEIRFRAIDDGLFAPKTLGCTAHQTDQEQ